MPSSNKEKQNNSSNIGKRLMEHGAAFSRLSYNFLNMYDYIIILPSVSTSTFFEYMDSIAQPNASKVALTTYSLAYNRRAQSLS